MPSPFSPAIPERLPGSKACDPSDVFIASERVKRPVGICLWRAFWGPASAAVILGVTSGAMAADAPPAQNPPAAKAVRTFDINEFDVEDNTVLDTRTIEAAVMPFLGPGRTMSDIDGARAALQQAYAAKGFQTVYVVIPPQTVRGGLVLLKPVEAKFGVVAVTGASAAQGRVQAALPSLAPGAVPNLPALNRELVALNSRSNDLQVTPQMKPGAKPDTIDVNLDVQDKTPLHGSLELDNKYSRDTSPLRLQASLSYDDLWQSNNSLSVLYSVAPQNPADGEVYSATYAAPLPGTDIKLSLSGLRSNSNVSTLGSTDVLGRGYSVTLGATMPLPAFENYFHYLQLGFAYKQFTDTVSLADQSSAAPITYYPLSVTYGGSWRGAADQVTLNAGLTMSFRGLGSDRDAFDFARAFAGGDFVYFRGGLNWLHNLPHGIDLYAGVDGQVANGPLVSNEQFSAGGDGTVRGYLQSEALGDDGFHSTLELRSPTLAPYLSNRIDDLRFVLFGDTALAWLQNALPQQQNYFVLRSVGAGLTMQALDYLNGSVFVSDPLDTTVGPGLSGSTHAGQTRVQFRLYSQF